MNLLEKVELRKDSLEIEKTRIPLWYGLVARIEGGQSESHFYVNAGGINEAILLAQQVCPEQALIGPYEIYVCGQEFGRGLDREFGFDRQAVKTLQILMPLP